MAGRKLLPEGAEEWQEIDDEGVDLVRLALAERVAGKPLLAAAMRGLVPAPLLTRTAKGERGPDFYPALRRHRTELLQLFDGSLLAAMGLIDTAQLRAALLGPHPTPRILAPLSQTLACESWLRSLSHPITIGFPR